MAKISVARSFSRSAESYDDYAAIQSEVGERLLTLLDRDTYTTILDLGCGTGNFTGILRARFADAEIHAVDISPAMIQVAARKLDNRQVTLWVADVEMMELTPGTAIGDWIAVEGAVRVGQQVVTRGNERLFPGQQVVPEPLEYELP